MPPPSNSTELHLRVLRRLDAGKTVASFIRQTGEDAGEVYRALYDMQRWTRTTTRKALVEEAGRQGLLEQVASADREP